MPSSDVTRDEALSMIGKVWAGNAGNELFSLFNYGDYQAAYDLARTKVNEQNEKEAKMPDRVNQAANELEDLAMIAKLMVTDLREGKDNPYGRVYWLRKQLGYTVAKLGVGVPKGLDVIETEYEKQLPI